MDDREREIRFNALFAQAADHMAARRWPAAAAAWQLLLRLDPERAEVWDGLGSVAHHTDRHTEAERLFRRAAELRPENANYHDHLGVALRALGRFDEAVAQYEKALEIQPERASTLNNLGNALLEAGQAESAAEMLRRAVALAPGSASFHLNLARALVRCQRLGEAIEQLELVRGSTTDPQIEIERGHVLTMIERWEEAIAAYRRAEAAGVRNVAMYHNLATLLQYLGRSEEAAEAYRAALSIRPDFALSRRQLTGIRKYEPGDRDTEELVALLKEPKLGVAERAEAHMALAKIFDDLGDYQRAFFHLQAGNQHIRGMTDYSIGQNRDYVEAAIETFDRRFFAERRDFSLDSEVPLFILGMPRSGTTLVEQILASHPEVHGAGELKKLNELFVSLRHRLTPDLGIPRIARLIDRAVAQDLGREYLNHLTGFALGRRIITDKMPFNFRMLGLIALLFPKARIIHCRRDPRDIGLSCYFARFQNEMSFAFNLVEIGRYYCDYERLMAHWRQVVGNPMIEVQYEALIADQEGETRRLLEFCGLEWDERCLKFYDTERAVLTASSWQVRQPVYASSVGRWQHYKEWLEPLFAALGPYARGAEPGVSGDIAQPASRSPLPVAS
jgi:tetratricopeptide (TPR) repeat protein